MHFIDTSCVASLWVEMMRVWHICVYSCYCHGLIANPFRDGAVLLENLKTAGPNGRKRSRKSVQPRPLPLNTTIAACTATTAAAACGSYGTSGHNCDNWNRTATMCRTTIIHSVRQIITIRKKNALRSPDTRIYDNG